MIADDGMVFGPTIPEYLDLTFRFDANGYSEAGLFIDTLSNCTINWGDGNSTYVSSSGSNHTNEYPDSGVYIIVVTGSVDYFETTTGVGGYTDIISFGNVGLTRFDCISADNLVGVPQYLPPTVYSLEYSFQNCTILNDANITYWNTASVTDTANCFAGALNFNQAIGVWDTINVGYMNGMFQGASAFNQGLNAWNTSNVFNMGSMFENATSFNGNISAWDTSSVDDFSNMFKGATSFNQNLDLWDTTAVGLGNPFVNMSNMFNGATNFDGYITPWDVSYVNNMDYMFENASTFNQDLSPWCVINILSTPPAFDTGASVWVQPRPNWGICPPRLQLVYDTSLISGTTIYLYFGGPMDVIVEWGDGYSSSYNTTGTRSHTYGADGIYSVSVRGSLTQLGQGVDSFPTQEALTDVLNWGNIGIQKLTYAALNADNLNSVPNTLPSTVSNLSGLFASANTFNDANVSNWNTSNVTDMGGMFAGAAAFNQNLYSWNTSNVTDMGSMFSGATSFDSNISTWNTNNVLYMNSMFNGAANFSGNVTTWNTANVENMSYMFANATSFNGNIGAWNTDNVTDMTAMFDGANVFNQNISSWSTGNVTAMDNMFNNATVFNQNLTGWCVTNIVTEPVNFSTGSALTGGNKPVWGTCPP